MRIWPYVLAAGVFCLMGEAMLRFDARTGFFAGRMRLANESRRTSLLESVETGRFAPADREYRLMIVGDSYLYGAGVRKDRIFAEQLGARLTKTAAPGLRSISVLDVTRPGNNTYTNLRDFHSHARTFKPHAVVWGYNPNDVYGQLSEASGGKPRPAGDGSRLERTRAIRRTLFSLKLLELLLTKANLELKLAGFVLPGTEFHHQVKHSHHPTYPGWLRSQELLRSLIRHCENSNIRLVVVNLPELNMLPKYDLYAPVSRTIADFFRAERVQYIDAAEAFASEKVENFAVSRYDGHPNEHAHEIIAEFVHKHLSVPMHGRQSPTLASFDPAETEAGNRKH